MGLSSSQSRFLSLQNRQNDVVCELMILTNRKAAIARETKLVSKSYTKSMQDTILKFSTDCGANMYDISYDVLMKLNGVNPKKPYIVTDKQGRVVVDDNELVVNGVSTGVSLRDLAYVISTFSGFDSSGNIQNIYDLRVDETNTSGKKSVDDDCYYATEDPSDVNLRNYIAKKLGLINTYTNSFTKEKIMDFYDNIFRMISERGWVYDENVNDETNAKDSAKYLNSMLNSNEYYLTDCMMVSSTQTDYLTKQATQIATVYSVVDENAVEASFGVYTARKAEISLKEKKLDQRIKMLETEQEVLNTEMEQIKTVRNENTENFFKIFA